VKEAEAIALRAWQVLECRDAGRIDLRCDQDGEPLFMEVNPLAGLHPFHSDLPIICNQVGMPYERLIREIVDSASERVESRVVGKGAIG
jgi:D-alanine-D-alanine ligase